MVNEKTGRLINVWLNAEQAHRGISQIHCWTDQELIAVKRGGSNASSVEVSNTVKAKIKAR